MNAVATDLRPYIRCRAAARPPQGVHAARPLATLAETGGRLAVFDVTFVPGAEPPAHIHRSATEAIFMLQGRLDGWVGDTALLIRSGEMAVLPRSVPRCWQVMAGADGVARGLVLFAPEATACARPLPAFAQPAANDVDWVPTGYQPRIRRLSTQKPCFHLPGETFRALVDREETEGRLTATLWMALGKSRKAPHVHLDADEALYVLDGAVAIEADGWSVTAYPGDFVFLPRGILHSHRAADESAAQALLVQTPGAPHPARTPLERLPLAEPALA